MEIRKICLLMLVQVFIVTTSVAQSDILNEYCGNNAGAKINKLVFAPHLDSLYIAYKEDKDGINFELINTTDKTKYIFSSYFSNTFYQSKYIHRIDKKKQTYKISFLPILPFLATKTTDLLIIGDNRIVSKGQILYDFIKLEPNTFYTLKIPFDKVFKNIGIKNDLVCDIDLKKINKYDKIKFKHISSEKLKSKYRLVFEFAIYNQVDVVCEQSAYYLEEFKFNSQAKAYEVITIPVQLNNFSHPLF